jgi:hypothetical protein
MESLIEDAVRGVGVAVLRLVSFGQYRRDERNGLLLEGAVGLLTLGMVFYLLHELGAR